MVQLAERLATAGAGLLVVDMARALADPAVEGHAPAGPPAAEQCRQALEAARDAGLPVWFSRGGKRWHTSAASPLAEVQRGSWLRVNGWKEESRDQAQLAMAITPQLQPRDGEVLITKSKPSAFFGTPLISQMVGARVELLVVVGMMTSGCVRATVTDAFSYDLEVVLPAECLADVDAAAHEANLGDMGRKYATVCSTEDLVAALTRRAGVPSAETTPAEGARR